MEFRQRFIAALERFPATATIHSGSAAKTSTISTRLREVFSTNTRTSVSKAWMGRQIWLDRLGLAYCSSDFTTSRPRRQAMSMIP